MRGLIRCLGVSVLVAAGLSACMPALAHAQGKSVTATDGWVRLPAEGETSTVAFAAVNNPGMYPIYLLSASSDVAGKVELRDATKGTQALDEVPVQQYETTYMNAKGVHLFLSALKRPLKVGETIRIAVKTDTAETINIEAVVKKD